MPRCPLLYALLGFACFAGSAAADPGSARLELTAPAEGHALEEGVAVELRWRAAGIDPLSRVAVEVEWSEGQWFQVAEATAGAGGLTWMPKRGFGAARLRLVLIAQRAPAEAPAAPKTPAAPPASTSASIAKALTWLASAQSPDGHWDSDNWEGMKAGGARGFEAGDARYDVGLTGLALLAFSVNGHTHKAGLYQEAVSKALKWLLARQSKGGVIGFKSGEEIYNHAIATRALCELVKATGDEALKAAATKAVAFCVKAQNPGMGWKYGVQPGMNDTSVTGWMVRALISARDAGIEVPEAAFAGAKAWFERVTARDGMAGYQYPGGGSSYIPSNKGRYAERPVNTAVSVACRLRVGEKASDGAIVRGAKILVDDLPTWKEDYSSINFYYWHYGTEAMRSVGGDGWKAWSVRCSSVLIEKQEADGSWPPVGEWCIAGGRVYATALNALTLTDMK